MEYRNLGRSGLKVSPLCLGTMMFGGADRRGRRPAASSRRRAEAGVNFIDTADAYTDGRSEEIVGRARRGRARRTGWSRPSSPTRSAPGPERARPVAAGTSMRAVRGEPAAARHRPHRHLYLHKEDHATPLEETVRALADLVRAGKIRYFGVSNYRAWRVAEICRSGRRGRDRPAGRRASPTTTR